MSFEIFDQYGNLIEDLIEFENLGELSGKKLRLFFHIDQGQGLPQKLSNRTYCQYEFYHQKDTITENQFGDDEEEESDGLDGIGDKDGP